jgi:uncharacterized metal-binding protein YceD (DUF177 family)
MSENDYPISHLFELGRLSQAGDEISIAPSPEDLARIARWADVEAVSSLCAKIDLRKLSPTRYTYDARLEADIVQSCVVTLEPVRSHIERSFRRELILSPTSQRVAKDIAVDVTPLDEDGREEIASLRYDLAVPVLEELALAIDPYPRAPGVAFEPPAGGADSPDHPFAALKGLKKPS